MSKNKHKDQIKIPFFIILIAKILYFFSIKWAEKFARKLFITPIKHKAPKREHHMEATALQTRLFIESIQKEIVVYEYGQATKKVLLIHGWSGRGTQLFKIADEMLANGYSTISFDAPAHGKSGTTTTIMLEFISSILELEKKYGPFEFAIAHSLGAMSLLNAIKQGLQVKKGVLIGSGNSVDKIVADFISKLKLPAKVGEQMKREFEKKYHAKMEDYAGYVAAKEVKIPMLVIHDKKDYEVPVDAAYGITENLENHQLIITEGLGHRKILGDAKVIQHITSFLVNN